MNNLLSYVIALYIRLSTEDSKVGSFSIENQRHALHQYIDAMEGVKNVEVLEFVDNGYSGTNFERPAVQEMLDLVRSGNINCIIVKDFTSFGRNSIEVGYFMEMVFPLYGIRFISINDEFDSDRLHGDTGGINVAFKYLISEFYSRDLSIKYKSAKYVKFRRGEYQSKICPYGYQKAAYSNRIEDYLEEKRVLYERLVLQEITMEGYKTQKTAIDTELDRLRKIHNDLKARTSQMQMDEQTKSAREELAREAVGAGGLTAKLTDTLIDRVYVYPGNQLEIVWKMKDFCMEGM